MIAESPTNPATGKPLTPALRETYRTAVALESSGIPVTIRALADRLGLLPSTTRDRARRLHRIGLWRWQATADIGNRLGPHGRRDTVRPKTLPAKVAWTPDHDGPLSARCRQYVREHKALLRRWGWHAAARRLSGRTG